MRPIPACCPTATPGRMTRATAEQLADAFRVLADPARVRLLGLIGSQPDGEACVCHLTRPLGLSQPTVSHHLKVLFEAGLLEREPRGTWVYYRLRREPLAVLQEMLAALAAHRPNV